MLSFLVELEESLKDGPLDSGGVIVNEENTLEVLYYCSGLMKQLFHKFPEILLVDATYNVNGVGTTVCLMAAIALVSSSGPLSRIN